MRSIFNLLQTLLLLFIFNGCNSDALDPPAPSISPSNNTSVSSSQVFGKWDTSLLPNNAKISSDFSNEEISAIETAMDAWTNGVDEKLIFFQTPTTTTANKEYKILDDFNDSEMGIYKNHIWYKDVGPYALAITQYWGVRVNANTSSEYIDIVHADVIINYRDHSFSLSPKAGEYDLQSVIVHELGHFIGLSHQSGKTNSVMSSTLSSRTIRRNLTSVDISTIISNYNLNSSSSSTSNLIVSNLSSDDSSEDESSNPKEEGEMVRGFFELRADGNCEHYSINKNGGVKLTPPPASLNHHSN